MRILKKTNKYISILLSSLLILIFLTIPAYAEYDFSSAKAYSIFSVMTAKNTANKVKAYYFKIELPDSGKVKFYAADINVSSKSSYIFLNSSGKKLLSGKVSELVANTISFKKKNTYYLRLALHSGDQIDKMYYTFDADNRINIKKSISVYENDSLNVNAYIQQFDGTVKWISKDTSIANVDNNNVIGNKSGTTDIWAYSSSGDCAKFIVNVLQEEKPDAIYLHGSNVIYVGESFKYTYTFSDEKQHLNHEIIWSLNDNGIIDPNGNVQAISKGTSVLTVYDQTAAISDQITIHFIESPNDIDFVPMINGIPIVNKSYPVPKNYSPGFNSDALRAYKQMVADAAKEGLEFTIISSFRSYEKQKEVYDFWVKYYGKEEADRCSARPGYSEHQLGLAIDVNSCFDDFVDTPECKWLADNCYKYGFILRYPSHESEKITGYMYEPWHIRYLGKDLAYDVYKSGLTLEEYLGIDSYYRT